MKILACIGLLLVSTFSFAAETLDAAAVKKLITGKTADVLTANTGEMRKTYFSADGKVVRQADDKTEEGTWTVEDDGSHCLQGVKGGCAMIVSNSDGTYDRVHKKKGNVLARWLSFTDGKSF